MADTHTITTTNPIMIDIGLGSFTTGVLYNWVTDKNGANLINITPDYWDAFFDKPNDPLAAMRHILTQNVPEGSDNQFYITTTRPKGKTFENKIYTNLDADTTYISNWKYNVNNLSYSFNSLKIGDFSSGAGEYADKITPIIQMSEWVNDKRHINETTYPARAVFFRDIRLSKSKGITWTNNVDIRLPGSDQVCTIPVEWKLSLQQKKPRRSHVAATKNPVFSISNQNSLGQQSGGRDDDGRQIGSKRAAGELSMWKDPVSGKMRAGNKLVMAVMTTDLAAAPAPENGVEATPKDSQDPVKGQGKTFGRARPIVMKDGNPFDWGPEYKYKNSCGLTTDEKNELYDVQVINVFSNVSFVKGEQVMLTDNGAEGVWQPLKIGTTDAAGVTPEVNGWEFMYLASNSTHYFRTAPVDFLGTPIGGGTLLNFPSYESAIYDLYYDINRHDSIILNAADRIIAVGTANVAQNGYVQLTSFDFMGDNVGGLRGAKHALSNTQIGARVDKEETNAINDRLPGDTTSPFFGCVFPGGYTGGEKYKSYKNKSLTTPLVTTNSNYIKTVPIEKTPFSADNSARNGVDLEEPGDMFSSRTDETLKNLPADIALNANSASTNGAPIPILNSKNGQAGIHHATKYRDDYLPATSDNGGSFKSRLNAFLSDESKRWAWLQSDATTGASAYDFAPLDKTTIQFRPLKADVYDSLEVDGVPFPNLFDKELGRFGSQQWNLLDDGLGPISRTVIDRADTSQPGIIGPHGQNGIPSFAYGVKDGLLNLPPDSTDFPFPYWVWTNQGEWLTLDARPGGAVGVIGAKCTVTATNVITFQTENNYGMDDFTSEGTLGTTANNSSFRNGTYSDLNCTEMFVRIYHAHPRHLTIYDPRYFAIHHFAEGPGDTVIRKTYYNGSSEIDYADTDTLNATLGNPPEEYTQAIASPDNIGYPDKYYISDSLTYDGGVDVRVPTLIGSDADQELGVIPIIGEEVVSDSPYREYKDWQVQGVHRGNLLPSVSTAMTIGMNAFYIELNDDSGSIEAPGGKGYSESDRFTTEGGNGTGVLLKPILIGGSISKFEVVDGKLGYNFRPNDFFSTEIITNNQHIWDSAQVKIVPTGTVTGQNLKAYVLTGIITNSPTTINRPAEASSSSFTKITGSVPTHPRFSAIFNQMYTGTDSVPVPITNPSSDNKYDVFLHYHNDISHTFGQTMTGRFVDNAIDQVIQLKMIPDGSATSSASASSSASSSASYADSNAATSAAVANIQSNAFQQTAFNAGTSALGSAGPLGGLIF